jgi:serine/threonine protein kinase
MVTPNSFLLFKAPESTNLYYKNNPFIPQSKIIIDDKNLSQGINFPDFITEFSDTYSYGMLLYEMFSGKIPFQEMKNEEVK